MLITEKGETIGGRVSRSLDGLIVIHSFHAFPSSYVMGIWTVLGVESRAQLRNMWPEHPIIARSGAFAARAGSEIEAEVVVLGLKRDSRTCR
jgi:hypothetical protein